MSSGAAAAVRILAPIITEVGHWLEGKEGQAKPRVLEQLPTELQSELALERLRLRHANGHELNADEKREIGEG